MESHYCYYCYARRNSVNESFCSCLKTISTNPNHQGDRVGRKSSKSFQPNIKRCLSQHLDWWAFLEFATDLIAWPAYTAGFPRSRRSGQTNKTIRTASHKRTARFVPWVWKLADGLIGWEACRNKWNYLPACRCSYRQRSSCNAYDWQESKVVYAIYKTHVRPNRRSTSDT